MDNLVGGLSLDIYCRMRTSLVLLAWLYLWEEAKGTLRTTGGLSGERWSQMRATGGPVMLRRSKRGWMWNQFFLLEEYTGNDDQYVGKVWEMGNFLFYFPFLF